MHSIMGFFRYKEQWMSYHYQWKYDDKERPEGCCYDCRMQYGEFQDMVIDDSDWEAINPTYHKGAGLLCPTCIANRLDHINLWYDRNYHLPVVSKNLHEIDNHLLVTHRKLGARIAKFVKERRGLLEISKETLADKTGLDINVINSIEIGNTEVSLKDLMLVLSMFGKTLDVTKWKSEG